MAITAAQLIANIQVNGAASAAGQLLGVGSAVDSAGSKLGVLAGGAAVAAGAAIIGIGAKSVQMAADFQSGMTSLVTGAGEAKSNLGLVSNGILQISQSTGTSTQQLTQGMYMIESAGFHGAAGLSVLQAAAEGAKVGNADLGTVANAVTTVMHNYASSGITATQATNALITTVAQGKTHMQDLAGSMSSVLPLAASLHIPFQQVAGAMATMTNSGMDAQRASMNLAFAIRAMNTESGPGTKALTSIGLSAEQLHNTLTSQGLPAALQLVEEHIGQKWPLSSMQGQEALKAIMGGAAGLNVALMLSGSHMKEFTGDVDAIGGALRSNSKEVTGWSQVQGDFNTKMSQFQATINVLMIRLGTALLPIVGQVVDMMTKFAGSLQSPGFQNFIGSIGTGIANTFHMIMNAMQSPIVQAIEKSFMQLGALLVSSFLPVIKQLEITWNTQLLPAFQKMLPALAPIGAIIGGVIVVALALLIATIVGVIKAIAGFLTGWIQLWGGVVQVISGAVQIIGNLLKLIWDLFHGNMTAVSQDLQGIWNGIVSIFQGFGNIFMGLVRAVIGTIVGLFSGFVQTIITFFTNLANTLVGHSIIPDMINAIVQWFSQLPGKVLAFITSLVSQAISSFTSFATQIGAAALNIVNTVVNFFSQLPGRAVTSISSLGSSVANYFAGLASSAYSWGANLVQGIVNGINSMASAAANAASNVVNSVKSFLGFHSPAEKGEGRYIIQWGEGMIQGFEQGIHNATPHLTQTVNMALATSMKPMSAAATSQFVPGVSVNQAPITVIVQPAPVVLNGQTITNAIMPSLSQSVRYHVGTHTI